MNTESRSMAAPQPGEGDLRLTPICDMALENERLLIGAMLWVASRNLGSPSEILDSTPVKAFGDPEHRRIWSAARELARAGGVIDAPRVVQQLTIMGLAPQLQNRAMNQMVDLISPQRGAPAIPELWPIYARRVRAEACKREVIAVAQRLIQMANEGDPADLADMAICSAEELAKAAAGLGGA